MNSIRFNTQYIRPSKVVCIGRNFVAHIEELGNDKPEEPVVFVKPNSAISRTLQGSDVEPIHYEGEISFLIINSNLAGVGFGLDLTKRETQSKLKVAGLPWERAKAFDGAAVFSNFVGISGDIENLRLELEINGVLTQQGSLASMINKPDDLVSEVGSFMTFEDGDILMTGTPEGVGIVNKGDRFIGRILSQDELLVEKTWHV